MTKLRGARQIGEAPNPSLLKKKELAESRKIWQNKNYAIQEVMTLDQLQTKKLISGVDNDL